jgi:hypothetical protein
LHREKPRGATAFVLGDRQRLAPILLALAGRSLAAILLLSPRPSAISENRKRSDGSSRARSAATRFPLATCGTRGRFYPVSPVFRAYVWKWLETEYKLLAQLERIGLTLDVLMKKEDIAKIEKYLADHRYQGQNICYESSQCFPLSQSTG